MSKPQSDATALKYARRQIKRLEERLRAAHGNAEIYRARSSKAEQECAEWKERFDILLRRDEARVEINSEPFRPITAPIIG